MQDPVLGPPISLLLVDDHEVLRLGLRSLFATVPRFNVVGEADTAATAVVAAEQYRPNVVMMDVRLPDASGVDACRAIRSRFPSTQVLMLSSFVDEEAIIGALVAGAAGYLLKHSPAEQLIEAVWVAARGGSLLDGAAAGLVATRLQQIGRQTESVVAPARRDNDTFAPGASKPRGDPLATLTTHERNIVALIARGLTNREIGANLSLSQHTVKDYVSVVLRKMGVRRRAEVAALVSRVTPLR